MILNHYNISDFKMWYLQSLTLILVIHMAYSLEGYEDMSNTNRVSRVTDLVQEERITNLPYGVVLKKIRVLDMSSSTWPHVFRIPHVPPLPQMDKYDVCSRIPHRIFDDILRKASGSRTQYRIAADGLKRKINHFCSKFKELEDRYNILMNQTMQEVRRQYSTMRDLILPNKTPRIPSVRTPRDVHEQCPNHPKGLHLDNATDTCPANHSQPHSRKRRGFDLSFLGEAVGNFFGLATTSDLRKLWSAITVIYKNSVNISDGFNKFADSMRSITSLNRKRIDHLSATMVRALENINNLAERID